MKKSYDDGWENSYFTSTDVYIIGYGFSVSQYPQFYVRDLYMYQLLPLPYIGSFDSCPGDKSILKMGVRLGKSSRNIFLGIYLNQDKN